MTAMQRCPGMELPKLDIFELRNFCTLCDIHLFQSQRELCPYVCLLCREFFSFLIYLRTVSHKLGPKRTLILYSLPCTSAQHALKPLVALRLYLFVLQKLAGTVDMLFLG